MAGVNPIEVEGVDELVLVGLKQLGKLVTRLVYTERCEGGGVVLSGAIKDGNQLATVRAWRGGLEVGAGLIEVITKANTIYRVEAEQDGRHRVSVDGRVESDDNKAWLGEQLSDFFGRDNLRVKKIDGGGQELQSGGEFEWRPIVVAEMPVSREQIIRPSPRLEQVVTGKKGGVVVGVEPEVEVGLVRWGSLVREFEFFVPRGGVATLSITDGQETTIITFSTAGYNATGRLLIEMRHPNGTQNFVVSSRGMGEWVAKSNLGDGCYEDMARENVPGFWKKVARAAARDSLEVMTSEGKKPWSWKSIIA